ncbi:hypothetical protein SLEP1_g1835 [Rubroshorea leprosula]|uniref:Uncharacterized protein n=1 Tax=Rubroshorea leprosula TaxID=152421 RepID=A0AAV5HL09_9ROSI|nr:hypothetical protein SLEP1_g1835 [Rubroshorea leprosula]
MSTKPLSALTYLTAHSLSSLLHSSSSSTQATPIYRREHSPLFLLSVAYNILESPILELCIRLQSVLQRVSTATPCLGRGMDAANSCKARLFGVPCHARTRVRARTRVPVAAVAAALCHDGLDLVPELTLRDNLPLPL